MKHNNKLINLIKKSYLRNLPLPERTRMDRRILDDATAALKQSKKTISASKQPNIGRAIMKSKTTKYAAAAALIIAVLLGLNFFAGSLGGNSPAFAEVLNKINQAHSVTYNSTLETETGMSFTVQEMIDESGIHRQVMPVGYIIITDHVSGKYIHLTPSMKLATLTQRVGRPRREGLTNYLNWISNMHERIGEFTGQEEIDSLMTNVFFVHGDFFEITIWVDPDTNLPVRVQQVHLANPNARSLSFTDIEFGGKGSIFRSYVNGNAEEKTLIMNDFQWNANLDESLFSLEPPEGYTVKERTFNEALPEEKHLKEGLAFWTEMSQGLFPSTINQLGEPDLIKPMLIDKFDRDGDPAEELDQAFSKGNIIIKGFSFANDRMEKSDWHYAGEGIRFGDANTPICWWKKDESGAYRVIYADLSVKDVRAEDLPKISHRKKDK